MSLDYNSSYLASKLPKKVNPFTALGMQVNNYESNWNTLEKYITNILKGLGNDTNLETLYRIAENSNPKDHKEIFYAVKKLLVNHIIDCNLKLKDETANGQVLNHLVILWKEYKSKIVVIKSILLFVDNKCWSNNSNLMSFNDMAIQIWSEMFTNGTLINRVIALNLKLIHKQRDGSNGDHFLSKSVAQMFIDLDLYQSFWESKYLEEARSYYSKECERKLEELSITDYLVYVNKRLEEENERSQMYLSGDSIRIQLRDQLVNIILKPQIDGLLKGGFDLMMKNKDLDNLELLYYLAQFVNSKSTDSSGIFYLRSYFKDYIMKSGNVIVKNPNDDVEKDKTMTQSLLDLKAYLDSLVDKCFKGDNSFYKTIRDCFESFLNARQNKPAEYLAKFLDSKLRSGNKDLTEEAMESIMDRVMTLFRFVHGRDVFEAFYLKDLAKRLLNGKSACVDTEKAMLEKLKHECGSNYTRKMEIMFSDIESSQRLSKQFLDTILSQNMKISSTKCLEFNVNVICNATWPSLGTSKLLNMTESMTNVKEAFTTFYKNNHSNRKLIFEPSLGHCIVRGYFPMGRKELQVSEFQCIVLMQFNGPKDLKLSYDEIEKAVGMESNILKKALLSLSVGKGQKVLCKNPQTTKINNNDVFSFNEDFHHKLTKIKFNQIQTKESKEERQATEEQVFADRKAHVDCCIVRLMKTHRTIDHNKLILEIVNQLRFPVKSHDIKKRIEHLIEIEYITRDSMNPSLYHYVA